MMDSTESLIARVWSWTGFRDRYPGNTELDGHSVPPYALLGFPGNFSPVLFTCTWDQFVPKERRHPHYAQKICLLIDNAFAATRG